MRRVSRRGGRRFVYDDFGATTHEETVLLLAAGRVTAASYFSINADASLTYVADGMSSPGSPWTTWC
jgi:hypothetical protein